MRRLKLMLLIFTVGSAVFFTYASAQSSQTQKKDSIEKQKRADARRDSIKKVNTNTDNDQNRKRTHKKNIDNEKNKR